MYPLSMLLANSVTQKVDFQEDMKVLMRTVSRQDLVEEPSALDALLVTEGWQTLMTFTRESARTSIVTFALAFC